MKGVGTMAKRERGSAGAAAGILAVFLLVSVAGLAAGCGKQEKPGAAHGQGPVVPGVEVETIIPAARERRVEAVGTVRAMTIAAVAPQAMGRVTQVLVSEGSRVARGALLAVIDDAPIAAQVSSAEGAVAEAEGAKAETGAAVAQAEAQKVLAEKTYARFKTLHEEKVVTQQEFDEVEAKRTVAARNYERALERRAQVQAKVAQAKGQARAARAMLSYTKVTAPFDGVVTEKRIDPGSMAVPGVPLFTIEDPRRYRIEASVPEGYLGTVKAGAKVEILLDSVPGRTFPGSVSEIVPAIDPLSRTFTAKAGISAPGLRTGMFGRVRFAAGTAEVLSVPKRAISRAGGYDSLFLVTPDNVARLTMVTTGEAFGDRVEVLSGIGPGARVATSALERLVDGARVEVRK